MDIKVNSEIVEVSDLQSFFAVADQKDVSFLGRDAKVVLWSYDLRKGELTTTEGMGKIYGYTLEELSAFSLTDFFFPQENEHIEKELKKFSKSRRPFQLKYKAMKKDGSAIWLITNGKPVLDQNNELIRINGMTKDITNEVAFEMELLETADQYQMLVEKSGQGIYIAQDGNFEYINREMSEMTGYSHSELLEMQYDQLLDEESKELVLKRVDAFLKGKDNGSQEVNVIKKDNTIIRVELRSSLITYRDRAALMGTLLDVTEKKNALDMVNRLAYYDTLTDLPNRNLFYKEIKEKLRAGKEQKQQLALLFIDLDQFKMINDNFGHSTGDVVIKEAAFTLNRLMKNKGFIARYGGDEFIAVLRYDNIIEIETLANQMIKEVPKSLSCEITVTPTIGISLFPEHGEDVDSLLRFADTAMYHSKQDENREHNYRIYNKSISDTALRNAKLTNDLQKAIDLEQFYLVYQPKVLLDNYMLEGVEALIRWEHPEYGSISPGDFIPWAEKSNHINEIGDWVLEKAIADMQRIDASLILNVNISARQLLQNTFISKVKSLLQTTSFPPEKLNLEITESVAIYDLGKTNQVLIQLRDIGVKVSLDDFGTGYSSLGYLTQLPIDYLKIDQSFIACMENDKSKKSIIKSIIDGTHNLDLKVVAEGIETKEQANLLRKYKCDIGQGYYFSKPLPYNGVMEYIKNNSLN